MKYLIVLSVVLMIISTSVEISSWGGVLGDSKRYSTKKRPSLKVKGNMDNKKVRVHSFSSFFCFICCLVHC